jgi:hypothetical protein
MPRQATAELCIRPETKELCKEAKPDGVTWDRWVRKEALGIER